ncbi:MAG TPA: glycosyltransferase, partial [Actinomycetes bacterium]|nr:glycosyltransferase [Actinomycetes bacterium]
MRGAAAALAVVIPARDEQRRIAACITSVVRALQATVLPATVVVVAHRCTDRTARIAEWVLGERGVVVADRSGRVSQARARGADLALTELARLTGAPPAGTWLLSTDADSTVPADWVNRILSHAEYGAAAVAGLASLDSLHGLTPGARRAYLDLVRAGIDGTTHRHAYAANLAVRADAYRAVGGWPRVEVGEEHALL